MKVVQINTFSYKATGSIMMGIHKMLCNNGHDSYIVWGRGRDAENDHEIAMKDDIGIKFHGIYTRLTDRTGFASWRATRKLLEKLDEIKPDIIHLHNIHGYFINIELLFRYSREKKIKVIWTLHDCWAVTGHCAYFDMIECEKWKTGCHHCEQKGIYPSSILLDESEQNWRKKKELFSGLDMTVVTPCRWLAGIVKQSYLKEYPIEVIYNGINLETFKPSFRKITKETYSPEGKPIVLGVASEWTGRKGLSDICKLAERKQNVQFVVVGLTLEQEKMLPSGIIGKQRTSDVQELVELYSATDVFLNPTYEDNFPTTNLEAIACGTPVITYDTGGSPEAIYLAQEYGGYKVGEVIKKDKSNKVELFKIEEAIDRSIRTITDTDRIRKCSEVFDENNRVLDYLILYQRVQKT